MGLTILMLLFAIGLIALGTWKEYGMVGAAGGLFLALGLATIFPQFDVETIKAFNRWWKTTVNWGSLAFDNASWASLTWALVIMFVAGGAGIWLARKKGWMILGGLSLLLLFVAIGIIFPHFLTQTGKSWVDDAENFGYWFVHAWVHPKTQ